MYNLSQKPSIDLSQYFVVEHNLSETEVQFQLLIDFVRL